jgi:hypothetical protein
VVRGIKMKKQVPSQLGKLVVSVVILGVLLVLMAGCGGGGGGGEVTTPGQGTPSTGDGSLTTYNAPESYVDAQITVGVSDGQGGVTWGSFTLPVVCCGYAKKNPDWPEGGVFPATPPTGGTPQATGPNQLPVIDSIVSEYTQIERGKSGKIKCIAHDPDGDKLTYTWDVDRGTIK